MSSLRHTIDIIPDKYNVKETGVVDDFICPRCDGRGIFSEQVGRDEYVDTPCCMCGGAKKVKAVIVIQWEPDFDS